MCFLGILFNSLYLTKIFHQFELWCIYYRWLKNKIQWRNIGIDFNFPDRFQIEVIVGLVSMTLGQVLFSNMQIYLWKSELRSLSIFKICPWKIFSSLNVTRSWSTKLVFPQNELYNWAIFWLLRAKFCGLETSANFHLIKKVINSLRLKITSVYYTVKEFVL
jgi:hypothetical protein